MEFTILYRNGRPSFPLSWFKRPLKDLLKGTYELASVPFFRLVGRLSSPSAQSSPGMILITGALGIGGGPFTFLRFMVDELMRSHKVVLTFRKSEVKTELLEYCSTKGIRLRVRSDGPDWLDVVKVGRIINATRPQFTIVNVGTFSQYFHLLSLRSPVLYYSHSIWHRPLPIHERIFLSVLRHRKMHRIFTVSRAAKASLDEAYFRDRKSPVDWLYNGVRDFWSEETVPQSGPFTVLTLGSVTWYKNPRLWRRIAERVVAGFPKGTVQFLWAGQGDEWEALASQNSESIHFVGFEPEPHRLLTQCSVYFQPSQFESFGLGVCEAMMFGKPVVVSDVGALPELVQDGREGFVVSLSNEDKMAEVISELIRDRAKLRIMGCAARKTYLDRFTPDHWKVAFDALLRERFDA